MRATEESCCKAESQSVLSSLGAAFAESVLRHSGSAASCPEQVGFSQGSELGETVSRVLGPGLDVRAEAV